MIVRNTDGPFGVVKDLLTMLFQRPQETSYGVTIHSMGLMEVLSDEELVGRSPNSDAPISSDST